jgi:hypothetical protein
MPTSTSKTPSPGSNLVLPKKAVRQTKAQVAKAPRRDSTQVLAKLTTLKDGRRQIISDPPLVVPVEELAGIL